MTRVILTEEPIHKRNLFTTHRYYPKARLFKIEAEDYSVIENLINKLVGYYTCMHCIGGQHSQWVLFLPVSENQISPVAVGEYIYTDSASDHQLLTPIELAQSNH